METGYLPNDKKITKYYSLIIAATSAAALGMTMLCLINNINDIYTHIYYIPIIIAAICYPKKGLYFSLLLTILFLFITVIFTNGDNRILIENFASGIVFVGVGAIASTLSEVLREDSLKYQRLFDNSGAATAVINKYNKIIYCNKDFENISGYDFKELKKKNWTELVSPDDLKEIFDETDIKTQKKPKQLQNREIRIINKKRDTTHTIASIHRISELKITLFSVIDISAKVEAEKILKIKEERFKKLFQQSTDAIFIHSITGRIFDANRNACKMTGYTLDELKQIPVIKFYADAEKDTAAINVEILKKTGHCEFESRFVQSKGNIIDVDIHSVVVDSDTKVVQTIIRDITLRKKNENALYIASKKLSILSSITRHDILNQIMVALANMAFAIEDSREEKIVEFIKKAENSVKTIQKQIEFSRDYQDMGGKPPKWQDIETIIDRCITNQSVPKSVTVLKEISGVEIYADPMLEKVFCNLIGNTLMHGGNVTTIKITVRETDDFYRIVYSDNGKGIPDEKKELIFKAGYGSNQGFGLYLVREILSITGINITEIGIFGQGAEFELLIEKNDLKFVKNS
ncbi:MAG: PAS domain-containing sensor histidine kinase [Methanomicrobium sp.]|nr:PAS domain-containing sensor histidine kinase [Methanomicrobium sp.]